MWTPSDFSTQLCILGMVPRSFPWFLPQGKQNEGKSFEVISDRSADHVGFMLLFKHSAFFGAKKLRWFLPQRKQF
jgi:hypothetical protein